MHNEKGQVALEFVILAGLMLVIAVIVFPYVTRQNELNKAMAAARDGAVFGASMRAVGFRGEGVKEISEGVVKIESLELENQGQVGDLQWYRIRFNVSAPGYMQENSTCTQSSIGGTITNQSRRYIYHAFSGNWPSTLASSVNTTSFSFTTACDFT